MGKTKQIEFFRLYLLDNGRRKDLASVDWRAQLGGIRSLSWEARTVDGVVYDPQIEDDHVMLGVHRPIKQDFMSKLDPDTESVSDLLSDKEASDELQTQTRIENFANSTAVLFMPGGSVVAIARGTTSSPRSTSVVNFLNALVPQHEHVHWKIEPLIAPDDVAALTSRAQGAVEFSTTVSTSRNLFMPDDAAGFVTYADTIADQLGANVEVKIQVTLLPESRSLLSQQRFLTKVRQSMPRVYNKANKTRARVVLPGGAEEELELVAHRLAATVDVDERVSESRRFSGLMDHLRVVSGEMESTVKALVDGVGGEEETTGGR